MSIRSRLVTSIAGLSLLAAAGACSSTTDDAAISSKRADLNAYDGTMIWGANAHPGGDGAYSSKAIDTQVYQLQQAGLKVYRMSIETIDNGSIQNLREAVDAGKKYGVQILPVLISLGKDSDGNAYLDNSKVSDFSAADRTAYDQGYSLGSFYGRNFGNDIPLWELGNEYDAIALGGGADGASYSHYDAQKFWLVRENLRGMSEGLKGANGGLRTMVDFLWCHTGFTDMLWTGAAPDNQRANAVSPVRWDVTGLHWYYGMNNGDPTTAACWAGPTNILAKANTNYGNPIWVTEFGDDDGAKTGNKPTMASRMEGMMERFKGLSRQYNVQAALVYELYDEATKSGPEAHFGLCGADGNCDGAGNDVFKMVQWFTSTRQYQLGQ